MLIFFYLFVCFSVLVHVQQLKSCRDGQLTSPHCSWSSLPEAVNQYLVNILSPSTDNCSLESAEEWP